MANFTYFEKAVIFLLQLLLSSDGWEGQGPHLSSLPTCYDYGRCFIYDSDWTIWSDSLRLYKLSIRETVKCESVSYSVVSDPLQSHRLQPTGLLCPRNSPGKNTGVGSHFLLQIIFPIQGLNLCLLHCLWILYCLSHLGKQELYQ